MRPVTAPARGLVRRLPPVMQRQDYALLLVALSAMSLGTQMVAVAVGWQVYAIHRSALDLGLIGLAEFVPLPLLALPAGHVADHVSRRLVFVASLVLEIGVMGGLVAVSLAGAAALWPFLALAAATGVAAAIGTPAARALAPAIVPVELLASALALRSTTLQMTVVAGPALGGLLFAVRPELVYSFAAGLLALALAATAGVSSAGATTVAVAERAPGLASVLQGLRFVRATPILLGAITLDLFAVLFGGAVALLPLYAREILHVGPVGLGILRSGPAVGAVAAGIRLTRRPLGRHAGRTLLVVVGAFGASMIVFGLSRWFAVSLLALAVSGFVDMFSVNIRTTTVALATPDPLRGRVNAVEMVFISASNELGAFESGAVAALVGAVPAVVGGGVLTVAIALGWRWLFPPLARVDRLEEVAPGSSAPGPGVLY